MTSNVGWHRQAASQTEAGDAHAAGRLSANPAAAAASAEARQMSRYRCSLHIHTLLT